MYMIMYDNYAIVSFVIHDNSCEDLLRVCEYVRACL